MPVAFFFFFFSLHHLLIWRSYMNVHRSGRHASVIKHILEQLEAFCLQKTRLEKSETLLTRFDISFLCSTLQISSLPSTSPHLHDSALFLWGSFLCLFIFFKRFSLLGLFCSMSQHKVLWNWILLFLSRHGRLFMLSSLSWLNKEGRDTKINIFSFAAWETWVTYQTLISQVIWHSI